MDYVILSHVHDSSAGRYEITIGHRITEIAQVETLVAAEPDGDGEQPDPTIELVDEEVEFIVAEETVVFADDDPQWLRDGQRLSDDEVIEIQVAAILEAERRAAPRPLDSVGRVL
jgi:hypothetical protein